MVTKIVASRLLKKYRLRCHAQRELGFHRQSNRFMLEDVTSIKHKRQMRPVNRMKEAITEFYCRDNNIRLTTGRKQTRTKEKRKEQKRFLNDTMLCLHQKYLSENPSSKLSYTPFSRLRPFWVVHPVAPTGTRVSVSGTKTCNSKPIDCTICTSYRAQM